MEFVIQLLIVLAALSSLFQVSQWGWAARLALALSIATLTYLIHPWVIEQSKGQLDIWMNDLVKMQNLAVIQVIEAVLFIMLDLAILKQYFGKPVKRSLRYAGFFPGFMLLAVVLYAQMMCFYSFSQLDFDVIAIYFSIGIGVIYFFIPLATRWIIPENYLRMELRYILGFGQILGGIIITIFCQGLPYRPQHIPFEWTPLLIVLGVSFTSILTGWFWSILRKKVKLKWKF